MTRAPRAAAAAIAPAPTPPQPSTSTVSDDVTSVRLTACMPIENGSTSASTSSGSDGDGTRRPAGTAANSASAPSRCTPSVWLFRQALGRPSRHAGQAPQFL